MAEAKKVDLADVLERLDALERENAALRAAKPGERVFPPPRPAPTEATGTGTHRANQRGYDSKGGIFYEEGQVLAPGLAVGSWMDPIGKRSAADPAEAV